MEFCDMCDNMLYLKAVRQELVKHCRHCNFEKVQSTGGAVKVSSTMYSEDDLLYLQFKNKFLRHDPTLPRVQDPKLPCPNENCTGPRDKPQVLYVKYHPVHMKYLYCCDYCGTMWRDGEKMM